MVGVEEDVVDGVPSEKSPNDRREGTIAVGCATRGDIEDTQGVAPLDGVEGTEVACPWVTDCGGGTGRDISASGCGTAVSWCKNTLQNICFYFQETFQKSYGNSSLNKVSFMLMVI